MEHPSGNDAFTVRDLLNGGFSSLGRPGSGKTSLLKLLLGGMVAIKKSSGLILGPKFEDVDWVRKLFEAKGRRDDLYVMNDDAELRMNFVDEIRRLGGDSREVVRGLLTINESLRGSDRKGGGESANFFEGETERCLYNAVEALRMADEPITTMNIQRFISTAAYDIKSLSDEKWMARYHNQVMTKAAKHCKSEDDQKDFQMLKDYWCGEFCSLAPNTRSCITTGVMGMLHISNTGICRKICGSDTNIRPIELLQRRKWLYVNLPPCGYGDSGVYVNCGIKYLMEKTVLGRRWTPEQGFNAIICDEAPLWISNFDGVYVNQARSRGGALCILTQSLHSLFGQAHGEEGKQRALSLISAFGTRLFHALGSAQDAEYASLLIGKSLQSFISASSPGRQELFSVLMGQSDYSSSFTERFEHVIQPADFMNGLRCGGKANGLVCDAIVVKNGEPFSHGQNWLRIEFSQE